MKTLLSALALTTALTVPALAIAKPVTLTTNMTQYGGDGAYLALYVTDASGAYMGSLWMAGDKAKYYEHLSDWYRRNCWPFGQLMDILKQKKGGAGMGAPFSIRVFCRTYWFERLCLWSHRGAGRRPARGLRSRRGGQRGYRASGRGLVYRSRFVLVLATAMPSPSN